jgi:hypothetical protein
MVEATGGGREGRANAAAGAEEVGGERTVLDFTLGTQDNPEAQTRYPGKKWRHGPHGWR